MRQIFALLSVRATARAENLVAAILLNEWEVKDCERGIDMEWHCSLGGVRRL